MIAWSLRAARDSGCFDRIIVSTDDPEVAQVAITHGGEAPFVRPAELSDDHCGTIPVIAHAAQWLAEQCERPTEICCIYATAPFVEAGDLRRGLDVLNSSGADYAFSVTSFPFPIQRAVRITPEHRLTMFQPEHAQTRSQDLDEAWHDAGQFYWGRAHAWIAGTPLFGEGSAPVVLPRHRVQDIDTQEDWDRAEIMFQAQHRADRMPTT
ncbi:CMP-N-acetylneuraminic acid synthetase [Sphingobium baderi LL03]|uniref:CMP-N-acetylneuraminic acid synthetase n=2 Tax=Sphingobium baderi TaxID=1332080 RepID=T0I538_9SPHN|nr:hypothetical protein L485_03890 [Sphingobium baderi LL03]KMS52224.1 CMP-N-acetylneuraminic acid synthetase [Sphingobium baderi LL03]